MTSFITSNLNWLAQILHDSADTLFATTAVRFALECMGHAWVGVQENLQALLLTTGVIIVLFIGAILIDKTLVLRMFYASRKSSKYGNAYIIPPLFVPPVPGLITVPPQLAHETTPAQVTSDGPVKPPAPSPRWEIFRVTNWLVAMVFVVSFWYSMVHSSDLKNPSLVGPKLVFIAFCLTLTYLLGFFGVSHIYREVASEARDGKARVASSSTSPTAKAAAGPAIVEYETEEMEMKRSVTRVAGADDEPDDLDEISGSAFWLFVLGLSSPFLLTAISAVVARTTMGAMLQSGFALAVSHVAALVLSFRMIDVPGLNSALDTLGLTPYVKLLEHRAGLPVGSLQLMTLAMMLMTLGRYLYTVYQRRAAAALKTSHLDGPDPRLPSAFPPPYPNGWYKICDSVEIPAGTCKYVRALGENMVVFRGVSGKVGVLDAYCPHLGANIGVGGRVVGDCVECPFHAWQFDASGSCTKIPYCSNVPKIARTRAWPVTEYYGIVCIYHDADGRAPPYELARCPEIESGKFEYRGRIRKLVHMHIQDFAENAADDAHFGVLHRKFDFPLLGRFIHIEHKTSWRSDEEHKHLSYFNNEANLALGDWNIPGTSAKASITFFGPGGVVHFRFSTPKGDILLFKLFTPVGPMYQNVEDIWFADTNIPKWLVSYIVGNFISAFSDDLQVWENKTYSHRALILKEDGPIGTLRRWYKQFHSPSTVSMEDAVRRHGGKTH